MQRKMSQLLRGCPQGIVYAWVRRGCAAVMSAHERRIGFRSLCGRAHDYDSGAPRCPCADAASVRGTPSFHELPCPTFLP